MASRSRSRQLAIQVLFQFEFSGYTPERVLELYWENTDDAQKNPADEGTRAFCTELVLGTADHQAELDHVISAYLKGWTLDRIVTIDLTVLRLAFYELLHRPQVPWRVVVDEAITLAKMYNDEKAANFVNGVLHAWASKNRPAGTESENESPSDETDAAPESPETDSDSEA